MFVFFRDQIHVTLAQSTLSMELVIFKPDQHLRIMDITSRFAEIVPEHIRPSYRDAEGELAEIRGMLRGMQYQRVVS